MSDYDNGVNGIAEVTENINKRIGLVLRSAT